MSPIMKLFIIVMALSVIETIITAYLKSPTRLGNAFEKSIAKKLNGKSITGIYGKVLRNVYLPKNEDETSEIDVLFITTIGLFVIECKNYKGWIFGKANSNKWTVTLPSGKNKSRKYHFYNPIKQNNSHIKPLTQFIETQFPDRDIMIYPFVVFSSRGVLKDVPDKIHYDIGYSHDLVACIQFAVEKNDPVITQVQVDNLYEEMKVFTKVSKDIKQQHKENIKNRYK